MCSKTMLKESANKASPYSRELWTYMDILHIRFTHIFMGTPSFICIPKSIVTALYSAAHMAESWAFFLSLIIIDILFHSWNNETNVIT